MQQFAVVGVEHHTCPLAVRETMVVGSAHLGEMLKRLHEATGIAESVILSTCARTEVYLWCDDSSLGVVGARDFLVDLNPNSRPFISIRQGEDALRHLFRVAAGLESQIIGEDEVAGQVRKAVEAARTAGTLDRNLSCVFAAAIACSRRVRATIASPDGPSSHTVATAVAQIARTQVDLAASRVLILGSGRVARLLAESFTGAREVTISSRNPATAEAMSQQLGVALADWDTALANLNSYDVICAATTSRRPLITADRFVASHPVLIFDLGVPRNVSQEAGSLPGVTLFHIDDVQLPAAIPAPGANLESHGSIVDAEVHDFVSRRSLDEVGPIIESLRAHVDRVREQEIARIQPQLQSLEPGEQRAVEVLIQRLVDRMFHHLVVRVKLAALTDDDLLRAAEFFFAHGEDSLFPDDPGVETPSEQEVETPAKSR